MTKPTGKHKVPRHRWSEADMQLMRQCYPNTNTANLAAVLGLTPHQVQFKAQDMGIYGKTKHDRWCKQLAAPVKTHGSCQHFEKGAHAP